MKTNASRRDTWASAVRACLTVLLLCAGLASAPAQTTPAATGTLTVPAGALKPGTYRVTLAGLHSSRAWSVQVH